MQSPYEFRLFCSFSCPHEAIGEITADWTGDGLEVPLPVCEEHKNKILGMRLDGQMTLW